MATASSLGYDNIQILSPYRLLRLKELKIVKLPNEHATLYYSGIIPEEMADSYIKKATVGDTIEVIQTENGNTIKTLFAGQIASIGVKTVMGVYYLEVEGISGTSMLDIKQKSRSFQNIKLKYQDLVKRVLADYPEANYKDRVFKDATLGKLVIQHSVTDWTFLKQLASRFGAVLIPDCTQVKPQFWIGLPDGETGVLADFEYTVIRDLSEYSDTVANYSELPIESFTFYEVESKQYLDLGDQVKMQEKKLRVAKLTAVMADGLLKFTYLLAPEQGIRQNLILNEQLIGAAFEGEIIDREKDKVKVHLEIDQEQPKDEACWIPYSSTYTAEGNSGWYCMPEVGDSVKVYCPDMDAGKAIVMNSIRKGGDGNSQMDDPSIKYFGNTHAKELMMSEQEVNFTASSENCELSLRLDQDHGVEIYSDKELVFTSKKNIDFDVEKNLDIKAKDGIYLYCNSSSFILDGHADIRGMKVTLDSIGQPAKKTSSPKEQEDNESKQEEKPDDKRNILDAVQLGLYVLGFIPVFGAVSDVANAGVSAARGDLAGAGLCLAAAVPGNGDCAAAVKIGYKAAKVAKAAKTVTKAGAGIRLGMMAYGAKSAGDGVMNAVEEVKEGDYVNAARDVLPAVVMTVTMGKSFTKSRGIKSNLADLDGVQKDMKASLDEGKGQAKCGPVEVRPPKNATPEQIAQTKAYVYGSNKALQEGALSPTGRVSTKGKLRLEATRAAQKEKQKAAAGGKPYKGHPGHVPDTTWTGNPEPHSWMD